MAGKPAFFTSVEDMQIKIDEYFKSCAGEYLKDLEGNIVLDKYSNPIIINSEPLTVTGLALAIGFNSRQGLLNYQVKDEYNDAITRAKSRVEKYAEKRLFDKEGSNGAKFSLSNNFDKWAEKSETKTEQTIINKDLDIKNRQEIIKELQAKIADKKENETT